MPEGAVADGTSPQGSDWISQCAHQICHTQLGPRLLAYLLESCSYKLSRSPEPFSYPLKLWPIDTNFIPLPSSVFAAIQLFAAIVNAKYLYLTYSYFHDLLENLPLLVLHVVVPKEDTVSRLLMAPFSVQIILR